MKKKKYSQIFPKKYKLNNYTPDIPYSYNYMYNIDVISSQKVIGEIKYYEPKENNILGDNCSYKKIIINKNTLEALNKEKNPKSKDKKNDNNDINLNNTKK